MRQSRPLARTTILSTSCHGCSLCCPGCHPPVQPDSGQSTPTYLCENRPVGIAPQDEFKAMIAGQLIAAHNGSDGDVDHGGEAGARASLAAMPNGRCRMQGGKSTGAPKGNKNASMGAIRERLWSAARGASRDKRTLKAFQTWSRPARDPTSNRHL